jgi:hypothetical protein
MLQICDFYYISRRNEIYFFREKLHLHGLHRNKVMHINLFLFFSKKDTLFDAISIVNFNSQKGLKDKEI